VVWVPAIGLYERAGHVSERRDRQQYVGVLEAGLERAQLDDELRLVDCPGGGARIREVELGLTAEEHQRLAGEDAVDVASRRQAGEVAADRVRRLAEEAERYAERLRLGMDLRRERM